MIFTLSIPEFITDSNHPLGTHNATWWQVSATTAFDVLIINTGWDTVNLLSIEVDIPNFSYARVRFQDDLELESDWSSPFYIYDPTPVSYGGGEDDELDTPILSSDCLED